MAENSKMCPICEQAVQAESVPQHRLILRYEGCACGAYCLEEHDKTTSVEQWDARKRRQLSALLRERHMKGDSVPLLVCDASMLPEAKAKVANVDALSADDLFVRWPATAPERIDRCLCSLANYRKEAGEVIELSTGDDANRDALLFATKVGEAQYYIEALKDYGWISTKGSVLAAWRLTITPEGWARVGELTGGVERRRNPAFVAMWFGGDERRGDMTKLYKRTILPAIEAAGYRGKRADTDEHNEPIMDRIIDDIRGTPFVIAELSNDNLGVYYEAGFAKGQGTEVIFCRKKDHRPHFDVSGINQVVYQDLTEFRTKLENRILGALGRGPYSVVPDSWSGNS